MMISRRTFPPGGWFWFQPQTNWPGPDSAACQSFFAGMTFDQAVDKIIQHRNANPRYAGQWATDPVSVGDELDLFTSLRLANDPNWCQGGVSPKRGSLPFLPPQTGRLGNVAGVVRKVASGVGVLVDMLGPSARAVPHEQAEKRAAVCSGGGVTSKCPHNEQGGLERWFTIPASETIRKQLAIKSDMKLETKWDKQLWTCVLCLCPLATKVHCELKTILAHMRPEVKSTLPAFCWIKTEERELTETQQAGIVGNAE